MVGLLISIGLLKPYHLIYLRHLHAGFFPNLGLAEFWVRYLTLFCLFSIIEDFEWFWMGSIHKVHEVPQGSILGATSFLLYINDLPDDVVCSITIYADDATVYSKCDQASDLSLMRSIKFFCTDVALYL